MWWFRGRRPYIVPVLLLAWAAAVAVLPNSVTRTPPVGAQAGDRPEGRAAADSLTLFNGEAGPDCYTPNPDGKACVTPRSSPEAAEHGIAVFGVGDAQGFGGFIAVLGHTSAAEWRYWFATQSTVYQLLHLPGEMKVCAEGDGLNVRAAPGVDREVVAVLPHLTTGTAEVFSLREPGVPATETTPGQAGSGWYRLSVPVAGWAPSRYLTDATVDATVNQPDCTIRNVREGTG